MRPDKYAEDEESVPAQFIDFGCYLSGGALVTNEHGVDECSWDGTEAHPELKCRFEYLDENDEIQCDDKCAPFNANRVMTDTGFYCEYDNFTYGKETREMIFDEEDVFHIGDF